MFYDREVLYLLFYKFITLGEKNLSTLWKILFTSFIEKITLKMGLRQNFLE